jgi:hypothetical protein
MSSARSSDLSRETVLTDDRGDLVMNFTFENDVNRDIEDVVRLGTFGQYDKARLIAEESLKDLDDEFTIAVEVMRLMYDQGDVVQLFKYTSALLAAKKTRKRHKSWTPMAICILYQMHDFCVAIRSHYQDPIVANRFEFDLSVEKFEDFDDEQVREA